MFFIKASNEMWMPCGPKQRGAVQTTMEELAAQGLASKVKGNAFNRAVLIVLCLKVMVKWQMGMF